MDNQSVMVDGWKRLGVRRGGVLLVHSSLRSFGQVDGGAETVILSLLEALGPEGTLLFPALSYASVGAHAPSFDVNHTPSCVGALPEYFRSRPGTTRSVHPTHSVTGVGRRVDELLSDHIRSTTPCGPFSPFAKLPGVDGQILFIGCGLRPNTSMHAIEERVVPAYLYGNVIDYQVILADGSQQKMSVRSHNFMGWIQRYDRLAQVLSEPGLRAGNVLQAGCFLVEATAMWAVALEAMKENPLCFVDKDAA